MSGLIEILVPLRLIIPLQRSDLLVSERVYEGGSEMGKREEGGRVKKSEKNGN